MGVTVNVNMMSVSHKGSSGVSIAFPDVCKTPTPAGPIPIPYPNIAMSSDTSKGSKKVKVDKKPAMLKSSKMSMSSGDEAGSAQGIVSNKIKGKAAFVNYSFDVKFEGKNVARLLDPMQQNSGSPANTFGPAQIQAPLQVGLAQIKACKDTQEKQREQDQLDSNWDKSGIFKGHRPKIQNVADRLQVVIYFRGSNDYCATKGWIPEGHQPKPCAARATKTISEKNVAKVQAWLDENVNGQPGEGSGVRSRVQLASLHATSATFDGRAPEYFGVCAVTEEGQDYGRPVKGGEFGSKRSFDGQRSYVGKWLTGDYDLMDLMGTDDECSRPFGGGGFATFKDQMNKELGWDGIQHPPQQAWNATPKKDKVPKKFSIAKIQKQWVADGGPVPKVEIGGGRDPLNAVDNELTVVAPGGAVVYLDEPEDVRLALKCCGCDR